MSKIRPDGFDFNTPDPDGWRCEVCNPNGKNRSGLVSAGYVGLSTTCAYGVPCGCCVNGLKPNIAQELGL